MMHPVMILECGVRLVIPKSFSTTPIPSMQPHAYRFTNKLVLAERRGVISKGRPNDHEAMSSDAANLSGREG